MELDWNVGIGGGRRPSASPVEADSPLACEYREGSEKTALGTGDLAGGVAARGWVCEGVA